MKRHVIQIAAALLLLAILPAGLLGAGLSPFLAPLNV